MEGKLRPSKEERTQGNEEPSKEMLKHERDAAGNCAKRRGVYVTYQKGKKGSSVPREGRRRGGGKAAEKRTVRLKAGRRTEVHERGGAGANSNHLPPSRPLGLTTENTREKRREKIYLR